MRTYRFLSLSIFGFLAMMCMPVMAADRFATLTLKDGRVFMDVVVRDVLVEGLKIMHQNGGGRIYSDLLPDAVVRRYRLNLADARAARAAAEKEKRDLLAIEASYNRERELKAIEKENSEKARLKAMQEIEQIQLAKKKKEKEQKEMREQELAEQRRRESVVQTTSCESSSSNRSLEDIREEGRRDEQRREAANRDEQRREAANRDAQHREELARESARRDEECRQEARRQEARCLEARRQEEGRRQDSQTVSSPSSGYGTCSPRSDSETSSASSSSAPPKRISSVPPINKR